MFVTLPAQAVRTRIDGTVAIITLQGVREPIRILYSDIELWAKLHDSVSLEAQLDEVAIRQAFRGIMNESLLFVEARRVEVAPPSQARIDAQWQLFFQSVGGAERLEQIRRSLNASEFEISMLIERRAWVESFLDANLQSADEISDGEIARIFESEPHPFTGLDYQEARPLLRNWIHRKHIETEIISWVNALTRRARVSISRAWAVLLGDVHHIIQE